jgi:hypothetical protein
MELDTDIKKFAFTMGYYSQLAREINHNSLIIFEFDSISNFYSGEKKVILLNDCFYVKKTLKIQVNTVIPYCRFLDV